MVTRFMRTSTSCFFAFGFSHIEMHHASSLISKSIRAFRDFIGIHYFFVSIVKLLLSLVLNWFRTTCLIMTAKLDAQR